MVFLWTAIKVEKYLAIVLENPNQFLIDKLYAFFCFLQYTDFAVRDFHNSVLLYIN